MNRLFINIAALCLFLFFFDGISCPTENEKGTPRVPVPSLPHRPREDNVQVPRPILPPAVRSSPSGPSPTPSPHIASPPVVPIAINTPATRPTAVPETHIPNLPSVPAHATMPYVPVQPELPHAEIMDNVMGRVLDIGAEEDGSLWIQVKEQLFSRTLKISLKGLENISVIRDGVSANLDDIKTGAMVNVIFSRQGEERIANFISIITEEELERMKDIGPEAREKVVPSE